jgi:hypothetical protein
MYGSIFRIICLGKNNENENAYDYSIKTNELCLLEYYTDHDMMTGDEVTRRRVSGYVIFPWAVISYFSYTYGESVECPFEPLAEFYSHIPDSAEIDEENKTIKLTFYGQKDENGNLISVKKNEEKYALLRFREESFEITLEEY